MTLNNNKKKMQQVCYYEVMKAKIFVFKRYTTSQTIKSIISTRLIILYGREMCLPMALYFIQFT